jgi:acyl carrier protein
MPNDPSLVKESELQRLVREVIADVLMVAPEAVTPDSRLVADLGAESIDFLDLVFRIEEALGVKIPPERWSQFVADRLPDRDLATAITTDIVVEFAERESRPPNRTV